jgi:hypothetical protein
VVPGEIEMDKLITALAPVFAAGLGIQQLFEILSPLVDRISADNKRIILGLVSFTLGLVLAFTAKLHVLQLLGVTPATGLDTIDAIVTGLIISGGTEGVNSILKFLKYKKENVKNEAASKSPLNAGAAGAVSTPTALAEINKK